MNLLRQSNHPCDKCGSWYRRGDDCNKCGNHSPDALIADTTKAIKGRLWSKKLHRYLTEKEIKAGLKGG